MPLLDVEGVVVRFGGHTAVDGASLAAEAGAVTGLIGPNGAGKTTLFNVVCGMQAPVRGKVTLDGEDLTHLPTHVRARRGLSRTFQRLELFGSLTARENLLVAAEIQPSRHDGDRSASVRADEVIDRCSLARFVDRRADELTTGQARLVELARALVVEPRVLLLDEPASGLDGDETDELAALLRGLVADGLAVLLVEHDVPLVMRVCDRLVVLDFGRVIADGDPAVVRHDPKVVEAYLGAPAAVAATGPAGADGDGQAPGGHAPEGSDREAGRG